MTFVYIVDSLSSEDLLEGYTIGMALRDTLKAIGIPTQYTLATNKEVFERTFKTRLPSCINNLNASPIIHLCMHGNEQGIKLTDGTVIDWINLKNLLISHQKPFMLCMASCYGIYAEYMVDIFSKKDMFNLLVGNTKEVTFAEMTVAYLAFYHHIFNNSDKNTISKDVVENAVESMKSASNNQNFKYKFPSEIRFAILGRISSLNMAQSYNMTQRSTM